VFENGVPRILSGPKRDEVRELLSILLSEEVRDFYRSPFLRVVKYMRLGIWGRQGMHTEFWCIKLYGNIHLEDREVDGRKILLQ
jgi:hypothetical protein